MKTLFFTVKHLQELWKTHELASFRCILETLQLPPFSQAALD